MKQDQKVSPEIQKLVAERNAAHMLMKQWLLENADEMASIICHIVPFINGDCDMEDLNKSMNVVNIAFATIALEVIKAKNRNEPLCLPVDATEMQNAIFDLTNFLKTMDSFGNMLRRYEDLPAFKMSLSAYGETEIYG